MDSDEFEDLKVVLARAEAPPPVTKMEESWVP